MDDYSQPDFYRFNQDSTLLINWISQSGIRLQSILDLGAGSGIIGIELARILGANELCLVELQEAYLPHLKINVDRFLPASCESEILMTSFSDFSPRKFDLIVCNPPYYLPGQGELPKNPERALARSFLKDSWEILLQKMEACFDERCFVILKQDQALFEKLKAMSKLQIKKHDLGQNMILELF